MSHSNRKNQVVAILLTSLSGACSGTSSSTNSGGSSAISIEGGAATTGGYSSTIALALTGGTATAGSTSSSAGAPASGGLSSGGGAVSTGGVAGGGVATGGRLQTGGAATGGVSPGGGAATGGVSAAAGVPSTGGTSAVAQTTLPDPGSVILYGSPYANVNMWYGPVDFAESEFHNACGLEDGSTYPAIIQNLYGNYLIGLDGQNIANVESHCDNCAQLTANGKTIIAHIVTYGIENGKNAIDLSPEAQSALGLSSSNWTGTWQFCSCPTNGSPIYYNFDSRQWSDENFWYMRIWTRNQRLPVTKLETKIGSGNWVAASQESDGAWQTQSGVDFSKGFQVRVTAVDDQQLVDTIPAPTGIDPSNPVAGQKNFQ